MSSIKKLAAELGDARKKHVACTEALARAQQALDGCCDPDEVERLDLAVKRSRASANAAAAELKSAEARFAQAERSTRSARLKELEGVANYPAFVSAISSPIEKFKRAREIAAEAVTEMHQVLNENHAAHREAVQLATDLSETTSAQMHSHVWARVHAFLALTDQNIRTPADLVSWLAAAQPGASQLEISNQMLALLNNGAMPFV